MNKQKSLKLNFIMNSVLTMSSFIFPLITFPYVSRILLPTGTGKVSFALSVISYFAMLAQLGIPTYGIRACAKVRDNREELTKVVQELFIINLVMSVFAYAAFFAALFMIPRFADDKILFLVVSFTILFNLIGIEWLYKALEQYTYITIRSILFKFVALIAMFLFVHKKSDYVIYGGISIFAASASNIFNFINVHKYIRMKPVGNYQLKRHLKAIVVFFAMSCTTIIYTNLDTVMLGVMKTDADVGYYSVSIKIKTILTSIITSLGAVLLPRASYYVEHELKEKFLHITTKAVNFVFLSAPAMMLYFMLFAKEGIFFLAGHKYAESVVPMQIIMPTIFLIGLTNIMGIQILVPLGKEKMVFYSELAGAFVDIIINIILIPKMGAAGAAVGTLAAEATVWFVQYLSLQEMRKQVYRHVKYRISLTALLLGCAASVWVKSLNLGNFMALFISSVLFFGVYVLTLTLLKEPLTMEMEAQMLEKIFKRPADICQK